MAPPLPPPRGEPVKPPATTRAGAQEEEEPPAPRPRLRATVTAPAAVVLAVGGMPVSRRPARQPLPILVPHDTSSARERRIGSARRSRLGRRTSTGLTETCPGGARRRGKRFEESAALSASGTAAAVAVAAAAAAAAAAVVVSLAWVEASSTAALGRATAAPTAAAVVAAVEVVVAAAVSEKVVVAGAETVVVAGTGEGRSARRRPRLGCRAASLAAFSLGVQPRATWAEVGTAAPTAAREAAADRRTRRRALAGRTRLRPRATMTRQDAATWIKVTTLGTLHDPRWPERSVFRGGGGSSSSSGRRRLTGPVQKRNFPGNSRKNGKFPRFFRCVGLRTLRLVTLAVVGVIDRYDW